MCIRDSDCSDQLSIPDRRDADFADRLSGRRTADLARFRQESGSLLPDAGLSCGIRTLELAAEAP